MPERVTGLYDRALFLQAYQQSKDYWAVTTRLTDLSIEELILGLRLAARLGGSRLSRRIAWEAFQREPSHPKVRYYTLHIQLRGRVTSSCLCKNLEGAVFPFQIKPLEDGVDDPIHALHVDKADHRSGATPDFHEAALDDVGGAQLAP